jgi:hypothetical protein
MAIPGYFIEIVSTRVFEAAARKLLTPEDRRAIELLLAAAPLQGALMKRTGGFRKMRFARPSRREGKSGGTRVIYYFRSRSQRVYLLDIYPKGEKVALTRSEENELRQIARLLDGEE